MPQTTPRKKSKRTVRKDGWFVTPKALGAIATILVIIGAVLGPIRDAMKLSASIDNLAAAVIDLKAVMGTQDRRLNAVEGAVASFKAMSDERAKIINAHEQRINALESRRQ